MSDPVGYDATLGYQDAPYVPNLDPLPLPPVISDHPPTPTLLTEEPDEQPSGTEP